MSSDGTAEDLVLPHSSETPEDTLASLNGGASRELFLRNLRMALPKGPVPKGREALWKVVLPVTRPDPAAPPGDPEDAESLRFIREGASQDSPGLLVVSLEGLSAIAASMGVPLSPEVTSRLPQAFINTMRGHAIHAMVVSRPDGPGLGLLRAVASVRIHVEVKQGRVFLHGIVPWTSTFVLTEGANDHPYTLLRVV